MSEKRNKARCRECELVQWRDDHVNCRRCGAKLPEPVVTIVERVVERIVFGQFPPSADCIRETSQAAALLGPTVARDHFPTMAEMEQTMVLAAYQRSNRRPVEAARLLGVGKTTIYRKLREMKARAA